MSCPQWSLWGAWLCPGCISYPCAYSRCLPKSFVPSQHLCTVCPAPSQLSQEKGLPWAPPCLWWKGEPRQHWGTKSLWMAAELAVSCTPKQVLKQAKQQLGKVVTHPQHPPLSTHLPGNVVGSSRQLQHWQPQLARWRIHWEWRGGIALGIVWGISPPARLAL